MFSFKDKEKLNLGSSILFGIRVAEKALLCVGKELFNNCNEVEMLQLDIEATPMQNWFNALCQSGDTRQIEMDGVFVVTPQE